MPAELFAVPFPNGVSSFRNAGDPGLVVFPGEFYGFADLGTFEI